MKNPSKQRFVKSDDGLMISIEFKLYALICATKTLCRAKHSVSKATIPRKSPFTKFSCYAILQFFVTKFCLHLFNWKLECLCRSYISKCIPSINQSIFPYHFNRLCHTESTQLFKKDYFCFSIANFIGMACQRLLRLKSCFINNLTDIVKLNQQDGLEKSSNFQ